MPRETNLNAASSALGARLREAREYVGFSLGETARFLDLSPGRLAAVEEGREAPADDVFERMIKLYHRHADWFAEGRPEPGLPAEIAQLADAADLSEADRRELARFADFVAGTSPSSARSDR